MTTKITGQNYKGTVELVLENDTGTFSLGNNSFGREIEVRIFDDGQTSLWVSKGKPRVSHELTDGRIIPIIAKGDLLPPEGVVVFTNPRFPKGDYLEASFTPGGSERR